MTQRVAGWCATSAMACAVWFAAAAAAPAQQRRDRLAMAIDEVQESLRGLDSIAEYSCVLVKRERIGGKLGASETLALKVRHEPFSVYVNYLAPEKAKDQEALFVTGRYDGKLMAHANGLRGKLIGTVALDPHGRFAMQGNRYPITETGVRRMAESWIEEIEHDQRLVPCAVKTMDNARINQRDCGCFEVVRNGHHKQVPFQMTRLYVDAELRLPVRYEAYEWPAKPGAAPQLAEEYTYLELQLEPEFTDADFDLGNPKYKFR